jgi:hypothetical protein
MAMLDVLLVCLSKAKMLLTKICVGLMALWRNIKEPIRACRQPFDING